MNTFVRIVNRGGAYTSVKKAQRYIERGLAVATAFDEAGRVQEISMLEAAELAMLRSMMAREKRVENVDDGIERRMAKSESGTRLKSLRGYRAPKQATMQLKSISDVGTGNHVAKLRDKLRRRQYRRDKGSSILSPPMCEA